MSWKNLKTLALVILVLLNVIFGVGVAVRYSNANYYSSEERTLATQLLKESGITVPPGILSAKKKNFSAYSRDISADDVKETAAYVFGRENVELSEGKVEVEYMSGKMTISPDGDIEFAREKEKLPTEFMRGTRLKEIIQIEESRKEYESLINDFFSIKRFAKARTNRGALKTSLSLYRLMQTEDGGRYVAVFTQNFGGLTGSGRLYVVFDGSEVMSCDGELVFLLPKKELKTENADLLDLLFKEKRIADEARVSPDAPQMEVSRVYYTYAQYSDGKSVYYVPVCNILYTEGTLRGYFLTNGEKIK